MKTVLRIIVRVLCWVAAVGVLIGLLIAVRHVFRTQKEKRQSEAANAAHEVFVPVRIAAVNRGALEETITVTGDVEALHKVKLVSKLPGWIDELRVEECDEVKKGQVIAIIDHEKIQAEVERAEAAVAVAKANIKSADVKVADALREKKRMEKLFKEGATNEQNADRAQTAYDAAVAQRELADANRKEAEAALRLAQVRRDDATVKSPITGVVSKKLLDQGNMVGKDDGIVMVVNVSSVKILADVSERYLSKLRVGETVARIAIDSLPGESFTGKVHKIYPSLDASTRSARVEIRVKNDSRRLMPGMYARVTLVLDRKADAIVAPVSAVVTNHDGMFVYILASDTARAKPVRLGIRSGDRAEIVSGLSEGEQIVVDGQNNLIDGSRVRVIAPDGTK